MNKKRLGLDIQDTEYAQRLHKMLDKMMSSEFQCLCYGEIQELQSIDVWLTDGEHLKEVNNGQALLILMADEKQAENLGWKGARIEPYISVRKMIKQIRIHMQNMEWRNESSVVERPLQGFHVAEESAVYMKRRKGSLMSVYSPIGGCGKSAFSMTLCECLAEIRPDKKIVYLNIEGASDWPMYFRVKGEFNLSDFLYNMLLGAMNSEMLIQCLEDITTRQDNGVYFIEPCNVFEDLNVLEEQEVLQLIDMLRDHFDYIICDLNTAFHSINKHFMQQSDLKFLLMNGTPSGRCKMEKYKEGLKKQNLEQDILGSGIYYLQIGGNGKVKRRQSEYMELPMVKELYVEKNGILSIRRNTEWYRKVKDIAEEVVIHARA